MSNEKIGLKDERQTIEPITPSKGSEVIFSHSTFLKFDAYRKAEMVEENRNNQLGYFSRRD